VHVEVVHDPPAQPLPGAALEEHVVRQDHAGAAVDVEDGGDVLQEVSRTATPGPANRFISARSWTAQPAARSCRSMSTRARCSAWSRETSAGVLTCLR
jgi:hypothetical protein